MKESSIDYLKSLNTSELYWLLKYVLVERTFDYAEAADEYSQPTETAKLAVIKHILLN